MSDTASGRGATALVADYVAAARPADLPAAVRREAVRSFVNFMGCTLGGADHPLVDAADRALSPYAGEGKATVIGRGTRRDVLLATLLNGASSAAHTYDDTHAEAIVHPSGPVAAGLLALAEQRPVTGADFLTAFILGVEIECRVSKAVSVAPAKPELIWVQTGIAGVIGAAVGAGKLLGLDAPQLRAAIGIAAVQAGGLRGGHGSMCTALLPAVAAQDGLRAALLAQAGFSGPEDAIESRYGFAAAFSAAPHLAHVTAGLGERFDLLLNTYKPYPCGIVIHPIIDACRALRAAHRFEPSDIRRLEVQIHPAALALTDRRHPQDSLAAQVSLYHWAAAALARPELGPREGEAACIADPAIVALRDKIAVQTDAAMATDAAAVRLHLDDGRILAQRIDHCRGSSRNPLTDDELTGKFRGQAAHRLPEPALTRLLARCWELADVSDVGELARLAVGGPAGS